MERVSRLFSILRIEEILEKVIPLLIAIAKPTRLLEIRSALIIFKFLFIENDLSDFKKVSQSN